MKMRWRPLVGGIGGVLLFGAALAGSQRKDPALSFFCVFRLNGSQLCDVKHFEAAGLDGISTAVRVMNPDQLLPGEIRITTSDFSPVFRTAIFNLLDHKPAVNSGSLVFFDSTLKKASSIEFGSVVLKEVELPSLDASKNALVETSFRLSVANVTRPATPPQPPAQPARTQAASNTPSGNVAAGLQPASGPGGQTTTRKDPLPSFLFKLSIDGLDTQFVPRIDRFRVVPGGTGDFTFTMRGLPVFNGFVDWKGPKAASLVYLNSKLQTVFKVGFTLTKRLLSETYDFASGLRTIKIECTCSGVQVRE